MTQFAKPTEEQRAGNDAPFRRSLTKAQAIVAREWVADSELTAQQLLERSRTLKAEFLAREAVRRERAA